MGAAVIGRPNVISIYPSRTVGTIYPHSLQFGSQKVTATSKPLIATLRNSGGAPLAISAITTTGEFVHTNACAKILAVGASCSVSVFFKPSAVGKNQGTLNISDASRVKSQQVILAGVGVN